MVLDTILYLNGTIYTMDVAQPRAQAMAVDSESGYILAVDTNDEVRRLGGQHTELVDLRGRTVLPGFIDAHIHLLSTAYRAHHIDATGSTSEDEVAGLVRERALQTPRGHWILGGQWDKNGWPGENFPDKASLDAAAPDHPVVLWSKDGHVLWVNSLALQRAGVYRNVDAGAGRVCEGGQARGNDESAFADEGVHIKAPYCGCPEYVFGTNPMRAWDGSVNCTENVADAPGASGRLLQA